jgi:hypothetical protein
MVYALADLGAQLLMDRLALQLVGTNSQLSRRPVLTLRVWIKRGSRLLSVPLPAPNAPSCCSFFLIEASGICYRRYPIMLVSGAFLISIGQQGIAEAVSSPLAFEAS